MFIFNISEICGYTDLSLRSIMVLIKAKGFGSWSLVLNILTHTWKLQIVYNLCFRKKNGLEEKLSP